MMNPELVEAMRQVKSRNEHAQLEGVPALERLVEVAEGENGQAHHVRRLLLGLYNSDQWPFELNRLRVLDLEIQADALRVIALDWCGTEVHQCLEANAETGEDGDDIMCRFWARETPD